ncbi:importin-11 [Selaginella moellendorffii]|uniref:importin-11 n=1 Tax=Selaginella moellendorffii TaxID=88036 RepID=UPI000D1CE399|nr:importin-11 [Selaginella moellendorffii]|eukprot:XP_024543668.1 importin-11 [Selaginella moellendorffii]
MAADLNAVYTLLQKALSPEESMRKSAEANLTALESLPGFCSCLLEIIATRDLDDQSDARWLASVYFKNSINRYWRHRRDAPGIPDVEKPYLRTKLLGLIREENQKVAVQLAVLIAKIARIDYPREWQDLFPNLLQNLQSSDVLTTLRVYMVLYQILKELSTMRLAAHQQNFHTITSQLFDFTWQHWCADTQAIVNEFSAFLSSSDRFVSSTQTLPMILERWLLCVKVLGRMLVFGFPSDLNSVQEVPPVKQVCPAILQTIKSFLQYRAAFPGTHQLHSFMEKALLKLMKVLVTVQNHHPFSFSSELVLPPVLNFACDQITEQKWDTDLFEPFLMRCMHCVQQVLQCKAYRPSKTGRVLGEISLTRDETKAKLARQAEQLLSSLLDKKRVLLLCETLLRRYLVYTSKDLEDWAQDPEGFHHEQSLVQYHDKLRPCAEALYIGLFENHREVLTPYVVEVLQQVSQDCPPPEPDAIVQLSPALLTKEAVYAGIGLAYYDLHDYIDFKLWYEGALVKELRNLHPNNRLLRRRIAWLVGQWVSKIDKDLRRPIYVSLLRLLGDGDLAVQLAACHSLQTLIDDVHFYEEEFVEFVSPCLELLFVFMKNAQELDSKLQVFSLVTLIIERLGEKVVPCTEKIMIFLPQVWQNSEGQSLLKIQVVLALQRLVAALGSQSPCCYTLLVPILQHVTDVNQPDELNILEDGLQLWSTTLRHAPVMIPELLVFFPHLVSALERSIDHLEVSMGIVESYVLLGGAEFLSRHGAGVASIFKMVIGHVKEKGTIRALSVLDTLIQCFPVDAPPLLEETLQSLFVIVINGRDESDAVRAMAGAILARVLVQNSNFFAHLSEQPSLSLKLQQSGVSLSASPVVLFFDSWLEKVDSLTTASKRKVCGLALCIWLTSREPLILDRLEQILGVCTSILEDEKSGVATGSGDYNWQNTEDGSESFRKQQIINSDPVNNLSLAPLLKEQLRTCASLHGEAAFNVALSRLHPRLITQLQQL